jgi:ankyrin repeat protein
VVAFLLQCGEDPNAQDNSGKTPLHVAAALGNREIIDLLLAAGARIIKCLFYILYFILLNIFLIYGEINTLDDNGATPLQRAAEHNQNSAVSKIVAVPGKLGKIEKKLKNSV